MLSTTKANLLKQLEQIEVLENTMEKYGLKEHDKSFTFKDHTAQEMTITLADNSQLKITKNNVVKVRLVGVNSFINLRLVMMLTAPQIIKLINDVETIECNAWFNTLDNEDRTEQQEKDHIKAEVKKLTNTLLHKNNSLK